MKAEDILRAVKQIDGRLIEEAAGMRETAEKKKKNRKRLRTAAAALAVCAGIAGSAAACAAGNGGGTGGDPQGAASTNNISCDAADGSKVERLASAVYPEQSPYPDERSSKFDEMYKKWRAQNDIRRAAAAAAEKPMQFCERTMSGFLSGTDGENRVYSPVNVYMALSMLAEISGGNSREQILGLLGADGIDGLRGQASSVWTANYKDDTATTSVLANSLWLNSDIPLNAGTLDILAEKYYASSFSGDPASPEMTEQLREWLNEQTGGLLKDAADGVTLDPETILSLCSTIYYRAKWENKFRKDDNDTRIFHSPSGDTEKEFMNRTDSYGPYYWGEDYGAVSLAFANGGCMWLLLPDEDKTADDILASGEYMSMIADSYNWTNSKTVKVNMSVPKFDVSSEMQLKEGLEALGVTDVFSISDSDFSPLIADGREAFVDSATHAARVVIDEDGVVAAAFTEMTVCGETMPPDDEVDFVLDRPFMFVIMSDMSHPLFAGVVNQP